MGECARFQLFSSVQCSCSVASDSLRPHGLQHARLPCPSNCSPKWLHQQYLLTFSFFFSHLLAPHITTAPHFSPKTTPGISTIPPETLSSSRYPHSMSYKSSGTGLVRPEWGQGRNWVLPWTQRPPQSRGVGRMGDILEQGYDYHLYGDNAGRYMQLSNVPRPL